MKVKKNQIYSGQWYSLKNPHRVSCCACGLTHVIVYRIGKNGCIEMKVRVSEKLTKYIRHKYRASLSK